MLIGYNDLQTVNSNLVKEWNYERNGKISPESLSKGSDKKVWWKCEHGHEWDCSVSHRVGGNNCPICSGKRVVSGYNDFATLYPDIMDGWDWEQNKNINYQWLGKSSSEKVWWKCKACGERFQRSIISHINSRKCPRCKGKV